ncbi:hypothetical protein AIIKEEIJ_04741 [Rhodococcus sp. YH1]|nr:hypothetical protein [Rhodococcus sp. YH1]
MLEVSELIAFGQHIFGEPNADRMRECGDEPVLVVQTLTLVADDRLTLPEPLDQGCAVHGAEQVLGAHLVLVLEHLTVEHGEARDDDETVRALVPRHGQLGTFGPLQGEGEGVLVAVEVEAAGRVRTDQHERRGFVEEHPAAALDLVPTGDVHHLHAPPRQHLTQVDVVGQRLHHGLIPGDDHVRVLHDQRHPGTVPGDAEAFAVVVGDRPVAAVVVVEVAAVLAAEEVDAGEPAVLDGLDRSGADTEHGLLEAAPEVAPPMALAPRQRAVGCPVRQDAGGLIERHPFGMVGDLQDRARLVALVGDVDAAVRLCAAVVQPGVAVVTVGDQFDERLLDRGEAPRIDPDHTLVHRNGGDCHRFCLVCSVGQS